MVTGSMDTTEDNGTMNGYIGRHASTRTVRQRKHALGRIASVSTVVAATAMLSFSPLVLAEEPNDVPIIVDVSSGTISTTGHDAMTGTDDSPDKAGMSVTVSPDEEWGGIESLNVPHTKSPAELKAEEEAKKQAEEKAKQEAEQAAAKAKAEQERKDTAGKTDSLIASSKDDGDNMDADDARGLSDYPDLIPSDATYRNGRWSSSDSRYRTVKFTGDGSIGSEVIRYALTYVGPVPYVWGGESMKYGTDCSGFVMQMLRDRAGIQVPHGSKALMSVGSKVDSLNDARPGDIITRDGHAALYVGDGWVVEQIHDGIRVNPVDWSFKSGYVIRRVL